MAWAFVVVIATVLAILILSARDGADKRRKRIQNVIDSEQDHFKVSRNDAISAFDEGDHDLAISHAMEALRIYSSNVRIHRGSDVKIHRLLGEAYHEKEEYLAAVGCFTRAIELDAQDAPTYRRRANSVIAGILKGQFQPTWEVAFADYADAVRLDSEDHVTHFFRGTAYFAKADYDQAIAGFTKAVQLEPTYAEAYCNRAAAYK